MNLSKYLNPMVGFTGLLALALSATMAFAEVKEKMKIKVMTDDGVSEAVTIENLKVGDSEVFVTDSGKEVLVTRNEETLLIELDGRQIEVKMPRIDSLHAGDHHQVQRRVFVSDDGELHTLDGDAIEAGDGQHVFVHKEVHGNLSDEEMAELMDGLDLDIEVEGDGTQDHEVIVIKKRIVAEEAEDAAAEDQN